MADTQIMPQPITTGTKKRKRAAVDSNTDAISKRTSGGHHDHINGTSQTFAEDFAQQLQSATHNMNNSMSNTAAVALNTNPLSPDAPSISFNSSGTGPDPNQQLSSFDMSDPSTQPTQSSPYMMGAYKPQDSTQGNTGRESTNGTSNKPVVGTDEWHKLRRDNHKEGKHLLPRETVPQLTPTVERRRREAINEGINALAMIVPNCEKNKGSILQRAVTYINELRAQVAQNGQNKSMEKAVLDQAVRELTEVNENLREQLKGTIYEMERLKKKVKDLGGTDDGLDNGD